MKRHLLTSSVIAMIIAVAFVTTIFAGQYRNVTKDTACEYGGTCWNDSGIYISTSAEMGGSDCKSTPSWVGYFDWDLSSETRTWQSASLKLTAYQHSGGNPPYTFTLYGVSDTSWTESNSQADPGFDSGTVLATATDDLSDNEVEFKDDGNNTMGTYFTNKKGGHAAVAVAITGGCGSVGGPTVTFEDHEGHGGSAPQSGNEADLIFWTGSGATVVTLHSMSSQTFNWPLYAGLAALAALVLAALGFGVRRFNS